jgi:hypothetical protein
MQAGGRLCRRWDVPEAHPLRESDMRILLLALVLTGSVAAQERRIAPSEEGLTLRVRGDSGRVAAMHIRIAGRLFSSLGVDTPYPGELSLGPGGNGTATGSLVGQIGQERGELTFTSDTPGVRLELLVAPHSGARTPRLFASGFTVSVVRDDAGALSVRSRP